MSAVAHILYPRIAATITLPVGTTAAGFPLTNLQNCSMAHTWKAGGVASDATFLVDLGSVQAVGALAILGHNLYSARNSGSTYTDIAISWSDDFVAWNVIIDSLTEDEMRITSDLPYIIPVDASARYFEIAISDPNATQAHAYEIAEMFVAGAVLSLTEPTSYQWTPHDMKAHSRTAGSDVGMGIPPHHSYITHDPKVEIGKQGIANDFFDDLVKSSAYPLTHAAPSFQHFIRTCWSLGAPFVYVPEYNSSQPSLWWLTVDVGNIDEYVVGETIRGNTSGNEVACVLAEPTWFNGGAAFRVVLVSGWDLSAWTASEDVEGLTSGTIHQFNSISSQLDSDHLLDFVVSQAARDLATFSHRRHWIGATVCRAPASGKLRTPFTESWRRKLEMSMQSTGEWTGR